MIPLRDTTRSATRPIITWILIAINAAVFLYEWSLRSASLQYFIITWGLVPARLHLLNPAALVLNPFPLVTLVTSTFIHGGWFHILSNMWIFFIFGDNVEDRMGPSRFLGFYLLSGILANLLQALAFPTSTVPAIGASGAIAGVLGAYILLYPTARILTLILIFIIPWFVEIPAFFYLGFWFITQLFSGFNSLGSNMGGVAWWAHIGGFLFGIVFARLFIPRLPPRYTPDFQYEDRFPPNPPNW